MLLNTNPGSVARFHKSENSRFFYFYVSLCASIKGWKFFIPKMIVDAIFLKITNKGTMLFTSTLDANGN